MMPVLIAHQHNRQQRERRARNSNLGEVMATRQEKSSLPFSDQAGEEVKEFFSNPSKDKEEESKENLIAVIVLTILSIVYLYILSFPSPHPPPFLSRRFIIPVDSQEAFDNFLEKHHGHVLAERNEEGLNDDFFFKPPGYAENQLSIYEHAPIVPSDQFLCQENWVSIRAEVNYRYLWLLGNSDRKLSATASQETPLHLRSFKMIPVNKDCSDGGYVTLRSVDDEHMFLYMNVESTEEVAKDNWIIRLGKATDEELSRDYRFHFLFEDAGFVLNRKGMAFINVRYEEDGSLVAGCTNDWDKSQVAGREYGAIMNFKFVNASAIQEALETEEKEIKLAKEQDDEDLKLIQSFPSSSEKRVISFGLYGGVPKYTHGAIRNAELAKIYFPGWICRYYVTSDVPPSIISDLSNFGAEIVNIPDGMGYISGMFYRFLVAADPTVDRYIIRDADSRLNARDRIAVEEWIESKKPVHILRDHVNHCNSINGGMWGGVMGALPSISEDISNWQDKDQYLSDINFLDTHVWQSVIHNHIAHDSYCCDKFPLTRPFPSRRPPTYQHVGQVFDENDNERRTDIEGFIRGVPIPVSCRKNVDWIYG